MRHSKNEGWKPKIIWIVTLRTQDGKRQISKFGDFSKTNYENLCEARDYAERLLWDPGTGPRWIQGFIEESSERQGETR
jgi:hypothetical protein